jgi:hypothetical protein
VFDGRAVVDALDGWPCLGFILGHHYVMGAIKDIVDLTRDLESRAKDRRDMDTIHKIQTLALSLQSQHAEIVERDVRLMEENATLKRQLEESNAEEIRIHRLIEFRRGKRTGGNWMAFCPKCHLPVGESEGVGGGLVAFSTAKHADCGWSAHPPVSVAQMIQDLGV